MNFRNAPDFMNLFPTTAQLRQAADSGEKQFASTAQLVRTLLEPVAPWRSLVDPALLSPEVGVPRLAASIAAESEHLGRGPSRGRRRFSEDPFD